MAALDSGMLILMDHRTLKKGLQALEVLLISTNLRLSSVAHVWQIAIRFARNLALPIVTPASTEPSQKASR